MVIIKPREAAPLRKVEVAVGPVKVAAARRELVQQLYPHAQALWQARKHQVRARSGVPVPREQCSDPLPLAWPPPCVCTDGGVGCRADAHAADHQRTTGNLTLHSSSSWSWDVRDWHFLPLCYCCSSSSSTASASCSRAPTPAHPGTPQPPVRPFIRSQAPGPSSRAGGARHVSGMQHGRSGGTG